MKRLDQSTMEGILRPGGQGSGWLAKLVLEDGIMQGYAILKGKGVVRSVEFSGKDIQLSTAVDAI